MCDDCSESTSDTSSDTSCDTSTDTSTDTTSELPEDTGDLSCDGSDELPDDSGDDSSSEETEVDDSTENVSDSEPESTETELPEDTGDWSCDGSDELPDGSDDDLSYGESEVDDSAEDVSDSELESTEMSESEESPEVDDNIEETDSDTELEDNSIDPHENGDTYDDGSDELPDNNGDEGSSEETEIDDSTENIADSEPESLETSDAEESPELDDSVEETDGDTSDVAEDETIDNDEVEKDDKELFGLGKSKKNDLTTEQNDYDNSPEAQELRDIGVKNVDLRECNPEYRKEVVDAVKNMYDQYPELRDQVRDIKCYKMDNDRTFASYGPTKYGEELGGRLNLNSTHFGSDGFRDELSSLSEQRWLTPNASPQSIVSHELGHGLHLDMCAKDSGLTYGSNPTKHEYAQMINQYADNVHAADIVDQACRDCNLNPSDPHTPYFMQNELSKYGASDKGEAFAEGIAEANTSSNPRPLATAINNRYTEYKNKMGV